MRKMMITGAALFGMLALAGCGNSSVDGEAVGQAKKISMKTPLLCPDYVEFDLSMGVLRNGSGSMSSQDVWFTVDKRDTANIALLKQAVEGSKLVKVTYDVKRMAICTHEHWLSKVEILKD